MAQILQDMTSYAADVPLNESSVSVTSVTAAPSRSGPLDAGESVTFVLAISQPVTVTGSPVLTLSDGATATYDSTASTATSLVFDYTVEAGQNTNDLQLSGLTLNGASIAAPGILSFATASSYAAGTEPFTVVAADVNGDGKPDLIVQDYDGGVEVLLNNGSGGFGSATAYAAGSALGPVAVADVNGDGKPDLIVTDGVLYRGSDSYVEVLLNNGSGGFGSATAYGASGDVASVVVADVNGDGKPDLIVVGQDVNGNGYLGVLLNNGSGGFGPATSYAAGNSPDSVAAADVNGDGKPDLIVMDENGVNVLLNNGSGGFGPATSYAAGSVPDSVAVADVNGDGKPDLIVADESGGVDVLLNNGSGGFGPATAYAAGNLPDSAAVADVNGDGKPDLIVADGNGGVDVLLNNGSGGFGPATSYAVGNLPNSVAVADVNGDGKPDLIVADGNGGVDVLLNNSQSPGTFNPASAASASGQDTGLVIDTTSPAVTVALVWDTGISATDGITSADALGGGGDPNAMVTISNGTTLLGTTTADTNGVWSFTPTLTDGSYNLTVSETDAAGNTASNALSFTLDATSPVVTVALVSDTGISAADGLTSDDALGGGGDPNAVVTISNGTTLLGTTTADATGVWSFTPTLADGSYNLTVSETDAAGNTGTTALSLTLDTAPPVVTPTTVKPAAEKGTNPTVLATVVPGDPGDTLVLSQTTGSGILSLGPVQNGVQQVLYTATGTSGQDTVSYTLTDQQSGVSVIEGPVQVQLDPSPTAATLSETVTFGSSTNLTTAILDADTSGLAEDTLTLTGDGTADTLGTVSLVNGRLTYTASGSGLQHIPANGSAVDSFTYTVSDPYGGTATGTVEVTVTNPATVINGPEYGNAVIEGTVGADIINAYDWSNTIYDNGGNDVVNAGQGEATIYTAGGDVVVHLNGYDNDVQGVPGAGGAGADGNDSVSGSLGDSAVALGNGQDSVSLDGDSNTVALGSGNDAVTLAGVSNVVILGNGQDTVIAGAGNDQVTVGDGSDTVTLGGSGNTVAGGDGNDTVSGAQGSSTVRLGDGDDVVTMAGTGNVISLGNGLDTVIAGAGSDQVTVGIGSDTVTLGGYEDTVAGGNGNDTVSGAQGGSMVTLGDGNDAVTLAGFGNVISLGNGQDAVTAGAGNDQVTVGYGSDTVALGGYGNTVAAGNGDDTVSGAQGGSTVMLGDGHDAVTLAGSGNVISLGNGQDTVIAGSGNDQVTIGNGNDTITLAGWSNSVTLGAGMDTVNSGSSDTITVNSTDLELKGGMGDTVFLGSGTASLDDLSQNTTVVVSGSSGCLSVSDLAKDPGFRLDLIGGVGGYTTVASVVNALQSDGHGGTELILGTGASMHTIDFIDTSKTVLTAAHFSIG